MGGGAQAAGRGTGRVLPAWMTAQESGNGPASTAAAPGARNVQGQFDDAEQGGRGKEQLTKAQKRRLKQKASGAPRKRDKHEGGQ